MSLFSLASKNVKRNFNNYFIYFFSIVFNVIVYYSFVSIRFNEQVENLVEGFLKAGSIFNAASVIIALFAAIFIWYSTSFFLKTRKKEIGLYALMGMRRKQIGRLLFFETLLMGVLALVVGIVFGAILSKLFVMILVKMIGLSVVVDFTVSLSAILYTVVTFGVLFLAVSLYGYTIIYRYKLVELFRAENTGEKEPRASMILALLGIVLIVIGYSGGLISSGNDSPGAFLAGIFYTLVTVVVGTFIFFRYSLVLIFNWAKKNKQRYYKGINIIGVNQLLFRIRGNARTLAMIAVLSATTLTSVGINYGLSYTFEEIIGERSPFTFAYISPDKEIDQKVEKIIARYPQHQLLNSAEVEFIKVNGKMNERERDFYLVSVSSFNEVARVKGWKDNFASDNPNEVWFFHYANKKDGDPYTGKTIETLADGRTDQFKIIKYKPYPVMNATQEDATVVVNDEVFNAYYDKGEVLRDKGYIISNRNESKEITKEVIRVVAPEAELSAYYTDFEMLNIPSKLILFIGIFLGLVFLISTGSIIYFKQLIEASEDRQRYDILRKIGVSRKEIRASISRQIMVVFAAPLLLGITHSLVAFEMFNRLLGANIVVPAVITVGGYIVIYLVYYFLTVASYNKIINS